LELLAFLQLGLEHDSGDDGWPPRKQFPEHLEPIFLV